MQYNDDDLQRLFAEMDTKKRLKALKGAFRREANRVRKTALNNLRGSIRTDKDLERGVRAIVFKRKAGFRVTIGTKKAGKSDKGYGFHTNRQGKEKPVLIWAEEGTKSRKSKKTTRYFTFGSGWRTGKNRGMMKRYGFMQKTREQVRDSVTRSLHEEVINSVQKEAKKHGCT